MSAIVLLFAVGLIMLGFEVVIPGGVLGVFGGLAMLGGCGLAFADYGISGGVLATVIALLLVAVMLYAEFVLLPKTAMGQKLFLKSAVTGKTAAGRAKDYNGREGRAVTTLAPSGYVLIDGERLDAFSRSGYVEAGAAVKVVGADNFRLIVTLKN